MAFTSEIFSFLTGFILPYIAEIIKAKLPEVKGKWLGWSVSSLVCIIFAFIGIKIEGSFDAENILASIGAGLISSQGFYNAYFKASGRDEKVNAFFKKLFSKK